MSIKNEHLNRYLQDKNNELKLSNFTFKNLFSIIHNQENRIFAEELVDYKIVKISYKEFEEYCYKFAGYLNQISDTKDSYVGLYMENSINWIACFWALLMLGYKPLLLNCKLPLEMNKSIVNTLNVKTIVTTSKLDLCENELIIEDNKYYIDDVLSMDKYVPNKWADEIAISSTSTSLNYKICCYSGSDFTYQVLNAKGIISQNKMIKAHYNGSLKLLTFLPFYHIFGLVAVYFWFSVFGRTFVFLHDYSGDTIFKTVRMHGVTHIFAVPLLWNTISKEIKSKISSLDSKKQRKINKALKFCLSLQSICPSLGMKISRKIFEQITNQTLGESVRFLISGGGYIASETITLFNSIGYPLFNGYGATELGITSVELRKNALKRTLGSVGKPFDSIEYKIDNGTLYVKGKSICSKIYYQNNEVLDVDKNEWFNTKDNAEKDKHNNYFINGRLDDVIIHKNGEKYNPDVLEKKILLTTVSNYCIFELDGLSCFLFETNKDCNLVKKKAIYDEINSCILEMNKSNYPIDRICYTTNRICAQNAIKVSRTLLKKKILENEINIYPFSSFLDKTEIKVETLQNETERIVTEIFSEVLEKSIDSIGVNDHFIFDLGGSSLDYCTLLVKLESEFRMSFNFKEHSCSSVREFSNYIIQEKGGK